MQKKHLTHITPSGDIRMADVETKMPTKRVAVAEAVVEMAPATLELLKKSSLPKGNALACAQSRRNYGGQTRQ